MIKENNAPYGAFSKFYRFIFRYKFYLILLVLMLSFNFFFKSVKIIGSSMEPTLLDRGRALALVNNNIIKYNPSRNDIVVFKSENYSDYYLIKRVVGLPGDLVEIVDNKVYINGNLLEEDYLKEDMLTQDLSCQLKEDEIFVMGDNRNNSADSRIPTIGSIKYKEQILGKIVIDFNNLFK